MNNISNIIDKTLHYWNDIEGANCARSTVCGLLEANGKKELIDSFYAAFLPMGGGVGERSICGAVIGTLSALGILLSAKVPISSTKKTEELIKAKINVWKTEFRKKYGSLICSSLLEDFTNDKGELDLDHPKRRQYCTEIVKTSVILAQRIID